MGEHCAWTNLILFLLELYSAKLTTGVVCLSKNASTTTTSVRIGRFRMAFFRLFFGKVISASFSPWELSCS
ncbi:uncharacterized protein EI90DRAFT_3051290 [Cantharellus anzutake]|uniref:uncharacterized protein n=1 Tax=Cantharellus anzutake TaxID=1750568 RepID=UPI0019063A31|nr:uncharacterized protein EI90DRAFT_3051290 [Cantharellus anzutake]KAF8334157.1 hypothetical protein EI90DRAFT_3051290 [Cantharellus anzutake]